MKKLLPLTAAILQILSVSAMAEAGNDRIHTMPVATPRLLDCLETVSRAFDVRIVYTGDLQRQNCGPLQDVSNLDVAINQALDGSELQWRRNRQGDVVVMDRAPQLTQVALNTLMVEDESELSSSNQFEKSIDEPGPLPSLTVFNEAVSSTVLNRQDLAVQSSPDFDLLMRYAPNVYGSGKAYAIRGVWRDSGERLYSNVFLDGMPIPVDMLDSSSLDAIELESISFLRGSQTSQASSASMGGAIELHSPDTSLDTRTIIGAQIDEESSAQGRISWQGMLGQNGWSARAALSSAKDNGSICNSSRRDCDLDEREVNSAIVKLRYEPEQIPQLDLRLGLFLNQSKTGDDVITTNSQANINNFEFVRTSFTNSTLQRESEALGFSVAGDWNFEPGILHWNAYYTAANSDFFRTNNLSNSIGDELNDGSLEERRGKLELSYERGLSIGTLAAGASLETRDLPQDRFQYSTIAGSALNPISTTPFSLLRERNGTEFDATTYSVFANWDVAFNAQWSMGLGLRWVDENLDEASIFQRDFTDSNCRIVSSFAAQNNQPCDLVFPTQNIINSNQSDQDALLPSLAIQYEANPNHSLSFIAQRGFASGGINLGLASGGTVTYESEQSDQVELAWRANWLDDKIESEVNVFYTDWNDRQVSQFSPSLQRIVVTNAGRSHAFGGEAQLRYVMNEVWSARLGVGILRTAIDALSPSNASSGSDFSGNVLPYSPELTAVLGLAWQQNGWFANLAAYHADEAFSSLGNAPGTRLPSYTSLDFNLGYGSENWQLSLYGKNTLDETIVESATILTNPGFPRFYQLGDPRRIGLAFEYRF